MGYKALRHTYGFGIHSPFAYRMVKDVVHPGHLYSWYGYEDIDAVVNANRTPAAVERKARMLLRLVAFLNPGSLYLPLGIEPVFHAAVTAVNSKMRIERKPAHIGECEMITSHADFLPLETLIRHVRHPGRSLALMDLPQGWAEAIFNALPEGLMLHSKHNAIIVNRAGMMKVAYSVML